MDKTKDKLIEAQRIYIAFIGKHIEAMESVLSVHSYWQTDDKDIKKGQELRDEIAKWEQ